jgi:hypothetical protein
VNLERLYLLAVPLGLSPRDIDRMPVADALLLLALLSAG